MVCDVGTRGDFEGGARLQPVDDSRGVGHAKGDVGLEMTMGRYAGDEIFEAKAACVKAVKLPLTSLRLRSEPLQPKTG